MDEWMAGCMTGLMIEQANPWVNTSNGTMNEHLFKKAYVSVGIHTFLQLLP